MQGVEENPPAWVIVAHLNFLSNDALFFLNTLLGEVRGLHEREQDFERFLIVGRAAEQVASLVERSESVGICSRLCVEVEYIAVFIFKQLVFQIVSNAFRHTAEIFFLLGLELGVNRTVFCTKQGFCGAESLHFADVNRKTALVLNMGVLFANLRAGNAFNFCFCHDVTPPLSWYP